MAIASGVGASVALPPDAQRWPCAALLGERGGRALVAVPAGRADALRSAAAAAEVSVVELGTAGGDQLRIAWRGAAGAMAVSLEALRAAWETPF
jgi:hypothetical protein